MRYGFIAEDTAAIDVHLATYDASGTVIGIDDRSIIAMLVAAVQDVTKITGGFRANLIAWLGSAENGIQDLFAKNLHAENIYADHGYFGDLTASSTVTAKQLCAQKSDGTPVCVRGDELSTLLSGSVLGANAHQEEAAAGAADDGQHQDQAPAALPAREATPDADAGTTTTSSVANPVNGNAPAASSTPDVVAPGAQSVGDNSPIVPMAATGTEATSSAQ